jgi:riboflavin synthase
VFTGLVQSLGRVAGLERDDDGVVVEIETELACELSEGDSVAVNGVCLTATAVTGSSFQAQAMNETLHRSALGDLDAGGAVNLELALRAGDRLGGHFVQGHVDGVGTIDRVTEDGFSRRVRVSADPELLRYVVVKGSITVNGVSLTVAELDEASFTVALIPETLERTTLGGAASGSRVNLEVDVLAKYVERLVNPQAGSSPSPHCEAGAGGANFEESR